MRALTSSVGAFAIAVLLSVTFASSIRAQPVSPVAPVPPVMPLPLPPPVPAPTLPAVSEPVRNTPPAVASDAQSSFEDVGLGSLTDGLPNLMKSRTAPTAAVPGQTPAQDPLLSSRPPPFQVGPDTPPPPENAQGFAGNRPIQDLSALVAGNFRDTKYKWYGFVRLDGIYDFRPMASTDSFVTSSIPIPQGRGQNTALNPRYTRFGFDTETPIKGTEWELRTRIEMDFFNGNTSGAFGSFPPRLRFAWADFGPFLLGQAASVFMDYDVFPNVLDYQGPGGMVLMRQPVAAFRIPIGDKFKFTVGVEQPYSDIQWLENGSWVVNPGSGIITTPGIGRNVQDLPDFTANGKYVGDYGHVQLAGILRKLTFQPGTGDSAFDTLGYGFNLSGSFHPWAALTGTPRSGDSATPLSKTRFLGQFAAGRGITRYFQDENGLGLDASYDPINGFRAIPSYGWFLAYEQWWAKKLASNFTFGQDALQLTNTLPGSTYQRAEYVSGNLIWLPVERMGVGLEYLYGFRKNKDGERGDNTRIQMAIQYRF